LKVINRYKSENPNLKSENIRILDWGCGRGKAVLKLLKMGYSAYGVEIDNKVLRKANSVFKANGFDPNKRLLLLDEIKSNSENFFDIIFSEQVFEHVKDLDSVIKEHYRLQKNGGVSFHIFPSSKMWKESHLRMPLVHWLPKNNIRLAYILFMVLINKKPQIKWPETEGKNFIDEAKVYYKYLNVKTFYRDNKEIKKIFEKNGFKVIYRINGFHSIKRKLIPVYLRRNGFPDQQVKFYANKS